MPRKFKIFFSVTAIVLSFFSVIAPTAVLAQTPTGLVPCGTVDKNSDGMIKDVGNVIEECHFSDFLTLITNITNYLIILGAAVSALAFGWAGFLMMTAGGEMSKIEQGKAIFGKVLIGFLIMLSAWLIVHAVNVGLIASGFFGNSGVQAI